MNKDFDIVIHGASGFTGRLVAEYMAQRHPNGRNAEGLRWAMGGRDAAKLAAVRDEIGAPADTPLVVTDVQDPASLAQMTPHATTPLAACPAGSHCSGREKT